MNMNDLIVVIRSSYERTAELCQRAVEDQVPKENVYVINEFPFEKALKTCYEIGIDSGAKWMMTADADILLGKNAIHDFRAAAENMPDYFFQIEGLLYDKLLGMYRNVGHRIYRTQYLKKAIEHIPSAGEVIRPESEVVNRMRQLGYDSLITLEVLGVHDYEQYFSDIYRKAFTYAKKHQYRLSSFTHLWSKEMTHDNDFVVAMKGLYDGLMFKGKVVIDSREFSERSKIALDELELAEKGIIHQMEDVFALPQSILEKMGPVPEERAAEIKLAELMRLSRNLRLRRQYQRLGTMRFIVYVLGSFLRNLGSELSKRADISYK